MRTVCLTIAYDGTAYSGWQRQDNARTIQGELERALARMTGRVVAVHGAGRTDAGVHALAMTASFTTATAIPCTGFLKGLNSMLPGDIKILKAVDQPDGFHARKNARNKTYRYCLDLSTVQSPISRLYSLHCPYPLDMERIDDCLQLLQGEHDFRAFEAVGSRDREKTCGRGAVRTILAARLDRLYSMGAKMPTIELTGDGFLRHMVRNIVGTLLLVGRGRMTKDEFVDVLTSRDRSRAGPTAPAHGLFLVSIDYGPGFSSLRYC